MNKKEQKQTQKNFYGYLELQSHNIELLVLYCDAFSLECI